jgi:cobalamin biosynthesis Mg chelatase CobN
MKQDELLKQAEAIQKGAIEYIERTQPIVDEYNQFKEAFAKKAHQVVGALVERHIVEADKSTELIDKLASDPSNALDLALSISRRVGIGDSLGKAAELSPSTSVDMDPFEKLYRFGDSRADVHNFDGSVE